MILRTLRHWQGTRQNDPPIVVSMRVESLSIVIFLVSAGREASTGTTLMMPTPIGQSLATSCDSKACLANRYAISGFSSANPGLTIWNSNSPGAKGTSMYTFASVRGTFTSMKYALSAISSRILLLFSLVKPVFLAIIPAVYGVMSFISLMTVSSSSVRR